MVVKIMLAKYREIKYSKKRDTVLEVEGYNARGSKGKPD